MSRLDTAGLLDLASFIERRTDLPFNMERHEDCFIGFTGHMLGQSKWRYYSMRNFAEHFGMSYDDAHDLCIRATWANTGFPALLSNITRDEAVAHLRAWVAANAGKVKHAPSNIGDDDAMTVED